jgi:small subunit ribosomal protein S8e|eukprot:CAMPEP_0119182576 /NCGR_PEP_ID=MMETSP1315-20130426/62266_1 /TAXON_ID=676789 /ORGANISM="Prasinoderma singularis, Strain RCC927" /LENGTH=205 /DNA_ID=CAMNT_0007176931 /DNA_START=47 /DNA_END=664 /DNA_ORIENTATION=+
MGISRDSVHKRRLTGGKQKQWHKKRKYDLGRVAVGCKLSANKTVRRIRVRGGNYKFRALRLDTGTFSWASEHSSKKTRIIDVIYNASNNELVRTKTLVKNCIVAVDATPFKAFYMQHYGLELGHKGVSVAETTPKDEGSNHHKRVIASRNKDRKLDALLEEQFATGRLLACVSSRPGQSGRCDGYILEGKELEFYKRVSAKKKKN